MGISFMDLGSDLFPNEARSQPTMTVGVTIRPNDIFDKVVKAYEKEVKRVSRHLSSPVEINISKYLTTLLYLHVANVRNELPSSYRHLTQKVAVPAVYMTLLSQIGEVTDRDFGLRFIPNFSPNAEEIMSPQELVETSDELFSLARLGMFVTSGLPSPKDSGSLGAMAADLVASGDILSYRYDHPVYGFIAAMFSFSHLTELIGANALRVRYGAQSDFEVLADTLTSFTSNHFNGSGSSG